jgi:hypothetical protein
MMDAFLYLGRILFLYPVLLPACPAYQRQWASGRYQQRQKKLAFIMCGGGLSEPILVIEQY